MRDVKSSNNLKECCRYESLKSTNKNLKGEFHYEFKEK